MWSLEHNNAVIGRWFLRWKSVDRKRLVKLLVERFHFTSDNNSIFYYYSAAQGTSSVFHVSINPGSSGLNSSPFPTQSNDTSGDRRSTRNNKRLAYPGDVVDDDELGEESAQKYISVLRKTVMDQRKQTKRLTQQNRRSQKRVNKLKSLLKELIEKTKNGNYVIES